MSKASLPIRTVRKLLWAAKCLQADPWASAVQAGIKSQALASAGVGAINVAGTIVAGSLVDKAGRKQLLLVSFLGMAASMLAMSAGLGLPSLQVGPTAATAPSPAAALAYAPSPQLFMPVLCHHSLHRTLLAAVAAHVPR